MPEDAEYILQRTRNVHGFYGASSMERCHALFLMLRVMRTDLECIQVADGSGHRGADAQVQGHCVLMRGISFTGFTFMFGEKKQ